MTDPPHLRIQHAVHGPMCHYCASLVGTMCTRYHVTVQADLQCDSFDSIFIKGKRQIAEP